MSAKSKSHELRDPAHASTMKKVSGLKLPPSTPRKGESILMKTPNVVGVDISHLQVGSRVWVPDAKVLWRMAEITAVDNDFADVFVPDSPDEKQQRVASSAMLGFDPSHLVDHVDLAQMNNMHEAPLLAVLHRRFLNVDIYTFTTDILISINPYKSIPLLYDITGFMAAAKSKLDCELKTPHLFTIAERAFRNMRAVRRSESTAQSIIVSGESGAGKTEASKHIMKYLTVVSRQVEEGPKGHTPNALNEKIEECVLLSNHVLESFGNAKTSRNDNSSRFGKYIQLLYNQEGRISGVAIKHFLLEKTRIVLPETNERNYHIFYQILAGLSSDEKQELGLGIATDYDFLTYGKCIEIDGVDDAADFHVMRSAMDKLGFSSLIQKDIFQVLAAILKLGNAKFVCQQNENEASQFSPDVPVKNIAALLGVDPTELEEKITSQTTVTGRGSILHMKLTCEQADHAKQAFCKYIYGEVFNYLISHMNTSVESKHSSFIGILDIFGFEIMPTNSFEQLCINYTNEMLQQQFNKHVFVLEQERYATEGISISVIEFQDNQKCLDLIQKPPSGIMPLLDEQIMLKRKINDRQLLTIYHQTHLDKHVNYGKPRFESDDFVIRHYAGDVIYSINGFISKNNDNLHEDLMMLLRSSSLKLISSIMSAPASVCSNIKSPRGESGPSTPSSRHNRQASSISGSTTVASKFKAQLGGLMDMLNSTTPHYIKCIKPNNIKFAGGFSTELVRDQLIYSGILEVIKIRQQGFPIRRPFDQFYEMFRIILRGKNFDFNVMEACRQIAAKSLEPNAFQIGKTEVYLRYGQLELLQSILRIVKGDIATVIQSKFWRRCVLRKEYNIMRKGYTLFQSKWRQVQLTRNYLLLKKWSVKLQASFRCKILSRSYQRKRSAAISIQAISRGFITRERLLRQIKQQKAAIQIQKIARGYLQRTQTYRLMKSQQASAVVIQSRIRGYFAVKRFCDSYSKIVLIQAIFRAYHNRQKFLLGKAAAVASQALIRKQLQRKKFMHQRKMVVRLQSWARMIPYRAEYLRQSKSARVIQRSVRGFLGRKFYASFKLSVSKIAYTFLMYHTKLAYRLQCTSASCIQRCVRVYMNRRSYLTALGSARRIQRQFRKWKTVHTLESELSQLRNDCSRRDSDSVILKLRKSPEFMHIRHGKPAFNTLLHIAAATGDLNVVKYIVLHDINTVKSVNSKGNTPLHEACANTRLDVSKFLLKCAASIKCNAPETDVETSHISKSNIKTNADANGVTVMSGYLKKRREASGWMQRFVVLKNTNQIPELQYFHGKHAVSAKSDKTLDLRQALFKKCENIPFAFEVHSPELLKGRNREGRLYFQAANELELQAWLACLRDTIPINLETRLFAMQRTQSSIEYIDLTNQRDWANNTNVVGETPLHLAAKNCSLIDPKEKVKSTLWALHNLSQPNATSSDPASEGDFKDSGNIPTKVDSSEGESIKLCLWLLEHGADINKMTHAKESALKRAIESNYLVLAKHLIDRGATTVELNPLETTVVQTLKTELAKTAITNAQSQDKEPVLFLLKQPGLIRNSSYVSVYIDQVGLPSALIYSRPRLVISVYDTQKNIIEKKQQVTCLPLTQSSVLFWGCTWHMQTPMENLPTGAAVLIEVVSSSKQGNLMPSSPRYGAVEPICWTFIHIDKRTTDTSSMNAEMYKYPLDLKFKKLQRFDGFISGEIFLSQA